MGRQKIDMKYIENPNNRQVTFSKRRSGIFNKADALVNLSGADIGVLIFSPTGRPYVYGNPTFFDVAELFLAGNQTSSGLSAKREAKKTIVVELQDELDHLMAEMDKKEVICKGLKKIHEENVANGYNVKGIDSLSLQDLIEFKNKVEVAHQEKLMLPKDMEN